VGLRERQIFLLRLLDDEKLLGEFGSCKIYDGCFGLTEEDFGLISALPFDHLKCKAAALKARSVNWDVQNIYKTIEQYRLETEEADNSAT
jgi:hypothetical protein